MYIRLLATLMLLLISVSAKALEQPSTQVFLLENELYYFGELDADANKRIGALYDAQKIKPDTLSIKSYGGSVDLGMELGSWVHSHKLNVKVLEICFSSCANYVFPAGVNKIVSNFAAIGYHGGVSSYSFSLDKDDPEFARIAALPDEQKKEAKAAWLATFLRSTAPKRELERQYFDSIGVQQRITTLGQSEENRRRFGPKAEGWTYSIDNFKKLGVDRIRVINPPWIPQFMDAPNSAELLPFLDVEN